MKESFDPRVFGSAAPSPRRSENFNNFNFNFAFPFRDQPYHLPPLEPYHLPPLEPSTLSQFIPLTVPDRRIDRPVFSGPSGAQFTTPPLSLWSSFPHLPSFPAPSPPPHPSNPNPIAAHLDQLPASGSGKRKSRDDDPGDDIAIDVRRPRKMPKRADLWSYGSEDFTTRKRFEIKGEMGISSYVWNCR
ncbi:hypothetical protein B0H17DRAFT_1188076 [Mycena rosella]|uniref:Uncharacterized protein n=1 Tax=Mycena rosella TaxID=1033263 RepID=A0AAD7BNV2_MYCRO|nr:hypothetical protein B0H17DRAFT_1188076 [Mycena rosella]